MISSLHLPTTGPRPTAISHNVHQLLINTDCKGQALYPGLGYQLQNQPQIPPGLGIRQLSITYTLLFCYYLCTAAIWAENIVIYVTLTIQ